MALLKRNTRRTSSPSSVSTLTILVFVALCIFAVYMLSSNSNSNSVVSPQTQNDDDESTSTRTAIDTTETETTNTDLSSSSEDGVAETTTTKATTTISEGNKKSSTPVFGDNPGHLPEDAIKSDDKKAIITDSNNEAQKQQSVVTTDSQISEESSLTQKEQVASAVREAVSGNTDEKAQQGGGSIVEALTSEGTSRRDDEETNKAQGGIAAEKQQVVQSFGTESKNIEDETNQEQLKEDKGETVKEDKNEEQLEHTEKQDESSLEKNEDDSTKKKIKGKKAKKPKKSWSTQADESKDEKTRQKDESSGVTEAPGDITWYLCNVTAGMDYIPCLDNEKAIKKLHSTKHFEHRERHCPEDAPTCLVPAPQDYKKRIDWPKSRDKIWYHNVPHTLLAQVKGHQNWVKVTGEFLTFPGGGTQFINGALHYIDNLQEAEPDIGWGKHTRVILDVGCGVGSFGGFLFERDVITMSFAPKDEHEAQVQFALERGIPAISAVMGSQRLPFPSRAFDLVHCARCRVPWHAEGGKLLLELNRVLRPGGYFVWSATPVYQKLEEDVQIWQEMTSLTKAMCWELVTVNKDALNKVGAAFYRKPTSNECYEQREQDQPPMCKDEDDPNAAWYVPLQACMHKVPVNKAERGSKWPEAWPRRLQKAPYWLNNSQIGIYGKPVPQDFVEDSERWNNVVDELSNIGVDWSSVRNVMDMRAVYGGFAAALKDFPLWVFNVVNVDAADTLPIIYERGLFGIYHDWCESFSTYPRSYDLLHADNLFSKLKERCKLVPVMAEVDRIVRPGGQLIVRDEASTIEEVESLLKSLQWEITVTKKQDGIICAKKGTWRPDTAASS